MSEALRLTRTGQLTEALALLQRMLGAARPGPGIPKLPLSSSLPGSHHTPGAEGLLNKSSGAG